MLQPGERCEIRPAYSSETGQRDIWDDIAGCEAEVIRDAGGQEVLVQIRAGDETWIARGRLRLLGDR